MDAAAHAASQANSAQQRAAPRKAAAAMAGNPGGLEGGGGARRRVKGIGSAMAGHSTPVIRKIQLPRRPKAPGAVPRGLGLGAFHHPPIEEAGHGQGKDRHKW